jgi:Bacterial Ig-like domain (group 2)/Carboxypeptidase regulatory-like domain
MKGLSPMRRFVALVLSGLILSACQGSKTAGSTTAPNPQATPTITALTITGVPSRGAVGQTVQLAVSVALSGADRKSVVPTDVTWSSTDTTVATVSPSGLLAVTGPGTADITAVFQGIAARASLVGGFVISGLLREAEPTSARTVAQAQIVVVGGSLDGQVYMTDDAGRFALPPVPAGHFTLNFAKQGYADLRVPVVEVPSDTQLNVSILPAPGMTQEIWEGRGDCSADFTFAVHYDGPVTVQECGSNVDRPSVYLHAERGTFYKFVAFCSAVGLPSAVTVPGGNAYFLALMGDMGDHLDGPCFGAHFRVVFTHPN